MSMSDPNTNLASTALKEEFCFPLAADPEPSMTGHKHDLPSMEVMSHSSKRAKLGDEDSPKKSVSFDSDVSARPCRSSKFTLAVEILRKVSSSNNSSINNNKPLLHLPKLSAESSSSEERRMEIASMLDQATRFAQAVQSSQRMRACASSPAIRGTSTTTPITTTKSEEPRMPPRGRRYRRRNSFVIHRGKGPSNIFPKGVGGGIGGNTQNASFGPPPTKFPATPLANNHAGSSDLTKGPMGLNKRESRLVFQDVVQKATVAVARKACLSLDHATTTD